MDSRFKYSLLDVHFRVQLELILTLFIIGSTTPNKRGVVCGNSIEMKKTHSAEKTRGLYEENIIALGKMCPLKITSFDSIY